MKEFHAFKLKIEIEKDIVHMTMSFNVFNIRHGQAALSILKIV